MSSVLLVCLVIGVELLLRLPHFKLGNACTFIDVDLQLILSLSASKFVSITCLSREWVAHTAGNNSSSGSDYFDEFHLIPVCCEALAP